MLPIERNMDGNQSADTTPLSGGTALLFGLGVMYFLRKKDSNQD